MRLRDIAKSELMALDEVRNVRLNGARHALFAPVEIEDDVWPGARVMVLKGVRIGEGSVIGAGSVVAGDVPPRVLAAGVPARVIREL